MPRVDREVHRLALRGAENQIPEFTRSVVDVLDASVPNHAYLRTRVGVKTSGLEAILRESGVRRSLRGPSSL